MSFKRFDTEDIVVSSDSITSPAWSNNAVKLTSFSTKGSQTGGNSGEYYHNVYNADPANDTTAEIQFSIAYGHRTGFGSVRYNSSVPNKSPSSTVYGQFRTLINGDEDTDFTFLSNGTVETPDSVFFISVERARFKEKILPGSLLLKLNNTFITDNGLVATTDTFTDAGRVYSLFPCDADKVISSSTIEYGKIYPDIGVIVLNGDKLATVAAIAAINVTDGPSTPPSPANITLLLNSLNYQTSNFTLRSEETLSSNYVFVRARNSEFNYSSNPSNITGSGELRHDVMIDTPQAYLTSVGLYNDNNDLIAISKLSSPLLKDFTKEALIRIKLDY